MFYLLLLAYFLEKIINDFNNQNFVLYNQIECNSFDEKEIRDGFKGKIFVNKWNIVMVIGYN